MYNVIIMFDDGSQRRVVAGSWEVTSNGDLLLREVQGGQDAGFTAGHWIEFSAEHTDEAVTEGDQNEN